MNSLYQSASNIILHLGVGSFHRAHQAVYLQYLMNQGYDDWSLVGANIRPDMEKVIIALQQQDHVYTLETVTAEGKRDYMSIQSIRSVIPWKPGLHEVIEIGAQANTRIISFTVTEGGYYLNEYDQLIENNEDLNSDLYHDTRLTLYGTVSAILRVRKAQQTGSVTLLNCDNLRSNGDRFWAGLKDFLEKRHELDLLEWIEKNTCCPNSMVDRITPRPSSAVKERVKTATGYDDACALMAEDFIDWVIEDHFCNGRPPLERVGVKMVDSVLPYEEAKIRILNSSHSCIAWAGTLKNLTFIHEGLQDPFIQQIVREYITQNVIPCLTPSPIDLYAYADTILSRFSSSYIADTNQRVAADGYSKIPGFLVPTIRERIVSNLSFTATALLPAIFFIFLQRWNRKQLPFVYQDPALNPENIQQIMASDDPLLAFCQDKSLWGTLAGHPALCFEMNQAMQRLQPWLDVKDTVSGSSRYDQAIGG